MGVAQLSLCVVIVLLLFAAGGPARGESPAPNATEACIKKNNHVWNGTACVPGCEGFQYLEDGVCLSMMRRISSWIQFVLCIVATFATMFLLPAEHAFLQPFLLSCICFGLLVNETTWVVLHCLPSFSVFAAKGAFYVAVRSLIVSFWTYTDLAVLFLMLMAPTILTQVKDATEPSQKRALACAKLLAVPLLLCWRQLGFAGSLLHLVPVYIAALAFAPVAQELLEDPQAAPNVKALQQTVREMAPGEVLLFYGLLSCCLLAPVICSVAQFLPDLLRNALVAVEAVALGLKASQLKCHLQAILAPPPPPPVPKGQSR